MRSLFPYRRIDMASTGYSTTAGSTAERKKAVEALRAWWVKNRGRDW